MYFAANDELQNGRLWDLTNEFQKKIKYLTNTLNYRYGWQSNNELEDTAQDLFLLTYEVLQKYQEKNNIIINSLSELSKDVIKQLKNELILAYRLKVWNNKSDNAVRMSDIYNIEKGSIDDTSISCIYDDNFIEVSNENIINNNSIKVKREKIIFTLTEIFQEDMRNIINKYLFGDDKHGMLTHKDIAAQNNRCRSAVTRRINRGFQKLSDFIKKYDIKLKQILYPTKEDIEYVLACTKEYSIHPIKRKISTKINNKKNAEIIHINTIKRKKNTILPIYKVTVHNIEEYLYA